MAIATARLFEFAVIDTASRYSGTDVPRARHNADLPIVPQELPKAKRKKRKPHDRDLKSTSVCIQEHLGLQSRVARRYGVSRARN